MCVECTFEAMHVLVVSWAKKRISDRMWQTLPLFFDHFIKDHTDDFTGKTIF